MSSLIPLLVTFLLALIFTPIMRKLAFKVGAFDIPKDNRRLHSEPIPFLGGVAIYMAVILGILIFDPFKDKTTIAIILGGSLIMVTGLIDDFKDLSPRMKLLFQILAGFILVGGGIRIRTITYPFSNSEAMASINLGIFSIPATIFWVVGITNTLNLIDGLDGLSAGVSAISSLSLMLVAHKLGYTSIGTMAAILAGACLGFLPYNFNPASIFMGDAGALFLGFMLSAISIEGVMKSAATITIVVPILILAIPIFDTTFAICRRIAKGQHPMQADKGHLHHRLLRRGYSQKKTALILYCVSMFFGATAVSIVNIDSKQSVRLSIVLFILALIFAMIIRKFEDDDVDNKDNMK